MARSFAWIIVVFALLAAALLRDAAWWLFEPHEFLWCGNVVSDPLRIELNIWLPLAWGCGLGMSRRCLISHRWPLLCQFAIVLLLATTIILLAMPRFLETEYGIPRCRIWWLPGVAETLVLGK